MGTRIFVTAIAIAVLGATSPAARAEEAAATRAQVEQLQKQLAEMQTEMAAMQKALRESEAKGNAYPMMQQHMMGMEQHWRMMHDQTCMMAPGSCPATGSGAAPR